jgi:hypothetical protein
MSTPKQPQPTANDHLVIDTEGVSSWCQRGDTFVGGRSPLSAPDDLSSARCVVSSRRLAP